MKFRPLFNPTRMQFNLTIGDWEATKGIQKISGFTRGLKFHQVDYFPYWHISNSIVLGYNRDSQSSPIRLFMYAYVDGKLIDPKECIIGLVDVGAKVKVNLEITESDYYASVIEPLKIIKTKQIKFDERKTLPIGWQLFPYAEIDGTNKKKKFEVEITDLKIS